MHFLDPINALFEALGSFFIWRSVLILHRDKEVRGVYKPVLFLSAIWSVECIFYYLGLDQPISASFACTRAAGSILWAGMALSYSTKKPALAKVVNLYERKKRRQ